MNKPLQPDQQLIRVFIAKYPFDVLSDYVPSSRREEIDNCQAADVAQGKYYVFKLLEIALREVYNVDMSGCRLERSLNGKWSCDLCELSLSHSGNVVAVAVSDKSVGVDVEPIDPSRFDNKLQMRILSTDEQAMLNSASVDERALYANRAWTVKEATFKRDGGQRFVASNINTVATDYSTVTAVADERSFFVTTVGQGSIEVKYHLINVQISGK